MESGRREFGFGGVVWRSRKSEYWKTGAAVLLLGAALTYNALVVAVVHELSVWGQRLPDAVFDAVALKPASWAFPVGDVLTILVGIIFAIFCLFHSICLIILRRFAMLAATIYFIRTICMSLTQLPSPFPDPAAKCDAQYPWNTTSASLGRIFYRAFLAMGTAGSTSAGSAPCGDLLFSGHTIPLTLAASFIQVYAPPRLLLLKIGVWFFAAFAFLCMVISRVHYSVDILISFVLCRFLFALFQAYVHTPHGHRRALGVQWSVTVFFLVEWMEAEVPWGPAPLEMAWHWSRPVAFHRLTRWLNVGALNFADLRAVAPARKELTRIATLAVVPPPDLDGSMKTASLYNSQTKALDLMKELAEPKIEKTQLASKSGKARSRTVRVPQAPSPGPQSSVAERKKSERVVIKGSTSKITTLAKSSTRRRPPPPPPPPVPLASSPSTVPSPSYPPTPLSNKPKNDKSSM